MEWWVYLHLCHHAAVVGSTRISQDGPISGWNLSFSLFQSFSFCFHNRGKKGITARNFQVINFGDITYTHSLSQVQGRTGTSLNLQSNEFSWNLLSIYIFTSPVLQMASFPFLTELTDPVSSTHSPTCLPHHLSVFIICLHIVFAIIHGLLWCFIKINI